MSKSTVWADYRNRPLTDEEKRWCHEWSLDWQVEENERLFGDPVESVDTKQILKNAGVEEPPAPPTPSPAGQSLYTGPLVVEGENDTPPEPGEIGVRVPLPRDHPFTGNVEEGEQLPGTTVVATEFDEDATWEEINALNVEELKSNLGEFEKTTSGSKNELRQRLFDAVKEAHEG